jgi:hypothetical protein
MKDLDPKSLIIGFLTASVVALVVALIQPKEETKVSEVGANEHHIFEVEHNGGTYLVIQKGQGIGITGAPRRRGLIFDVPGPPTNKTSETRSELPFNEKENSPLEDGK